MTNQKPPIAKTREPAYVLDGMAETILNPDSPRAYRRSCFNTVAKAIETGLLKPEDEIVLLGTTRDVFHAVVVDGDTLLVDSMKGPGAQDPSYDHASGVWTGQFGPQTQTLNTLERVSVADFKARYLDKTAP